MQKHAELTRKRIENFLENALKPRLWRPQMKLDAAIYQPQDGPRDYRQTLITPEDAARFEYTRVTAGYAWGPVWSDAWFRFTGAVPPVWKGRKVVARLDTGAESIVWDVDEPLQGIDAHHGEILLYPQAEGREQVTLYVQATGMNPEVSVHGAPKEPDPKPFTFRHAFLAVCDDELLGLYHDVKMALGVMDAQDPDSPRFGQLLYALNEVVNLYDADTPNSLPFARRRLALTYAKPANASAHRVSAIGHAHIDTAWLWPLERTQYKCLHTFATAIRLMDQVPEYKFVCSQAAQYEWVKQMCPALADRIREKIKMGQWEAEGSMWVEADCNLASGESLVRQILHGKNYFRDEYGIETKTLWLPDVFGYAASLPQILKKSGVDYFLTQKISWNQTNKFPHHTFLWQGIDGTQIFTHFPPADTYNAAMTPKELAYNSRNFREHDRATRSLYVFGYGDGGGGPTVEMLENYVRLKDTEGMPRVEIETTRAFFDKAVQDARDLPVWVGELYLELHRGTYTTQAANKKGNRRSEFLLRDAEFLSSVSPAGMEAYPREALDRAWKTTLLNQFHDIIPGSSIAEVYQDSALDYSEIARVTQEIIANATDALAENINTVGMKRPVLVISNLSHYASEAVEVSLAEDEEAPVAAVGPEGDIMAVQTNTDDNGARYAVFVAKNLPLHGYAVWDLNATRVPPEMDEEAVTVSETHLENEALRVEFDEETGLITRIFDKDSEREILGDCYELAQNGERGHMIVNGCANRMQLFDDKPLFWDAWDIDPFYQEKGRHLTELGSVEVMESGPVRGALRFRRVFGQSAVTQTVRLTAGSARLDFLTEVDWHESEKLLKVAFPVAINSPRAIYEIQYGHVERPTHYNTSWDQARFEVCGHKWADLSEGNYGVALLNDCKYGYDIHDGVLRLTLLRAPKAPDPNADIGSHAFTYSLLPHGGDFREGEVIENAYALNCPPTARAITANRSGPLPTERSFFEVDNAAVFIEAIKRAEKEPTLIVRLYEAHNTRGTVTLTTALPVKQAFLTDLMEHTLAELPLSDNAVTLPILPFEIITVKFTL